MRGCWVMCSRAYVRWGSGVVQRHVKFCGMEWVELQAEWGGQGPSSEGTLKL